VAGAPPSDFLEGVMTCYPALCRVRDYAEFRG
jgi:hypothetical protein